MDHLPRLHPDDLHELGTCISESLSESLKELLGKKDTLSKATTFSVKDVAKILGKHTTTVQKHIDKKLLHATKPGKDWIITQKALNDYTNGNK